VIVGYDFRQLTAVGVFVVSLSLIGSLFRHPSFSDVDIQAKSMGCGSVYSRQANHISTFGPNFCTSHTEAWHANC
jgi:hypothetical protein